MNHTVYGTRDNIPRLVWYGMVRRRGRLEVPGVL